MTGHGPALVWQGVQPSCHAEPALGVPSSPHRRAGQAAVVGQGLWPGGLMGLAAAIA